MPRKPKAGRPKPFAVGDLRVRAVRGPKGDAWYWRAENHVDGRRTVWSGWATKAEALEAVVELVHVGQADLADPGTYLATVDHLVRAWVAHLEDNRPDLAESSLKEYRASARRLREVIGTTSLLRLDRGALERARGIMMRTWSPRTVHTDLGRLRAAWDWARSIQHAPDHDLPAVKVRLPKVEKFTPSPAQIAAVLEHIHIPWRRLGIRLLYATGARIGEIGTLTWADVDLDEGLVVVDGKTGPRTIPLPLDLVRQLRAFRETHDRPEVLGVTANTCGNNIRSALKEACEEAGVPHFSPHALRRAAVDALLRAGVDVGTAAALLGHTPEVMLEHYRRATRSDLRDAVTRARLGALPEGKVIEFDRGSG